MSFDCSGDGEVTFRCNGCGKERKTRSMHGLPKGWCVSGALLSLWDPECGSHRDPSIGEATAAALAGHFCSILCGRGALRSRRVVEVVRRLGVAVALYSRCELVVVPGDGDPSWEEVVDPSPDDWERPDKPKSHPKYRLDGGNPAM